MHKRQLIAVTARKLDCSKAQARRVVDLFFGPGGVLGAELRKGGQVKLSGFGTFLTRRRAARNVQNPTTGRTMRIRAATVPVFRPGQDLRELVGRGRRQAERPSRS